MKLADLTVEVRDKNLLRLGQVRPEDMSFKVTDEFNNVGTWGMRLAADHPLAGPLSLPGAGIIVTGPESEMFSGPVTAPTYSTSKDDPAGTITFEGVSDSVALADALCWPNPGTADPTSFAVSHDVRTGPAETLMHTFVNLNCGPGAPAVRRKANLIMGTNGGRGATVKKSTRFDILGNLLTDLATVAGLGFRVIQRGSKLVFETYEVQDITSIIRLDVLNGTLISQKLSISPPAVTHVIVGGKGQAEDRYFHPSSTAESEAASAAWGRRIERFVDQRQTKELAQYEATGLQVLTAEGFTSVSVNAEPTDDTTMAFGTDWVLGDRVGVVVSDSGEYAATVSSYYLTVDSSGLKMGVGIGDAAPVGKRASAADRLDNTAQRVSSLERNAESGDPTDYVYNMMGAW